uniref:protein-serine/threonine phosphatase n=2 Tax=Rhizophora mucronata TaxID=61149 RepID=A0A2P2JKG1_RHIMU
MMLASIVGIVLLLMLFLVLILILIACRPWRFFSSYHSRVLKVGDLERPLISDDVNSRGQNNELLRNYDLEGACYHSEGLLRPSKTQGLVCKQRPSSTAFPLAPGDSLDIGVVSDQVEDVSVGQTLKFSLKTEQLAEVQKHVRLEEQSPSLKSAAGNDTLQDSVPRVIPDLSSCISLEVISGPSCGIRYSILSTSASRLPLTLGRVSSDLLLKDSEVSGKHAMINWNVDKKKWELVDMGSLNGTLLNSRPINHPDTGNRHWGDPFELSSGDIITLGTTSAIYVNVMSKSDSQMPFSVGMASDPMALRRGGKKLPMEDVCYNQWPLPGIEKFGVFGICDGHGGVAAAKSASKLLPEKITQILSDSMVRERVLSQCDASDVLKVAFSQTEASMNNYYEGCTATALLVWADGDGNFFAQCANVGDSACVMNVDGNVIRMTEDHRITSYSERLRINGAGEPLKDGETRLCGLNLARMLGDKFLKQQDARFSSDPYISQAVHIYKASNTFALLASDGFWDVIGVKKALQLLLQTRERYSTDGENVAEKIANFLLSEAKILRTKDNTSIIFLGFDSKSSKSCRLAS